MNDREQAEFESLKERQVELLRQMQVLGEQLRGKELLLDSAKRDLQQLRTTQTSHEQTSRRLAHEISQFQDRLSVPENKPVVDAPLPEPAARVPTQLAAPVVPPPVSRPPPPPPIPPAPAIPVIPAIPPIIPQRLKLAPSPAPAPAPPPPPPVAQPAQPSFAKAAPIAEPVHSTATAPPEIPIPPPTPPRSSFELRLGTYWLVRVGIVMLLTGVVFLGTYAYKNWVGRIGPAGKVTLLYLLSGTLLGLGAWLHRRQEALKNYAQVLFAGGLAAVYFTTYGAHHIAALRVIDSAVLDGALLFAWAGYVVWLADRRKSEVIALFAVGLAFYSSVMTQVGLFTLYSNLILTLTAVFFLVRNRWATLSVATLAATYGGYSFWRFYHGGEWHWASPDEGLWKGIYFLMSYWALFTAAVFTTGAPSFTGRNRAGFLSLNNAAFFTLFLLTMLQVRHGGFWQFALGYGSVLLALAALAWYRLREDKITTNAYLTQGLVLVTVGLVTHYSGLTLAVILATESVLLTLSNRFLSSRTIQFGSWVTGMIAVWAIVATMRPFVQRDLITGAFIGAAMLGNATANRWKKEEDRRLPSMIFFTVLTLIVWFYTTWQQAHGQWRALALAIESLLLLLASRPLRNFALRHGALPYAAVAVAWAVYTMNRNDRFGLYIGLAIGAVVLLDDLLCNDDSELGPYAGKRLFSILALVTWFATTWVFTPAEHRAAILALEGLLFVAAHRIVNANALTIGGFVFIFIAQLLCLANLLPNVGAGLTPAWLAAKLPWWNPVVVGAISLGVTHWIRKQKRLSLGEAESTGLQLFYVLPFLAVLYFWLHPFFSAETWLAFTALLAILVTAYGLMTRLLVLAAAGQIYLVYSVMAFLRLAVLGPNALKPAWYFALVPALVLVVLSLATGFRGLEKLRGVGLLYRGIAVGISVLWIFRYIAEPHYVWVLGLAGLCCFAASALKKNRELLVISAVYTVLSQLVLWSRAGSSMLTDWPNLLVVLMLLAQQVIAQRQSERYNLSREIQVTAILVGLASLWLWVSKWISEQAGGFYLTATWAGLALVIFAAGFVLKEKMYRWTGLVVLTCAMGRVVFLDIWRLETLYRILSFMALGIVLLVLGFIYTKYQEKIREWL